MNTREIAKKGLFFIGIVTLFVPVYAYAFSITGLIQSIFGASSDTVEGVGGVVDAPAEKPFPFLSAARGTLDAAAADIEIVDETSIASSVGPLGNAQEAADQSVAYRISTYKVRRGDTIQKIAKSFGVSDATIRWANNIPRGGSIKEGDELVILPVSGVRHTVARGDTVSSIAKKYDGDPDDILVFNGLAINEKLEIGSIVIVPDGEASEFAPAQNIPRPIIVRGSGPDLGGYYTAPLASYRKTRGLHGYNGIDIAAPRGSAVYAAADGVAIIARASGWNGGYGKYIVLSHPNNTQTVYGHLDAVLITPGQRVTRGQPIGLEGSTGRSTGPHLHFEIRGAKNPF